MLLGRQMAWRLPSPCAAGACKLMCPRLAGLGCDAFRPGPRLLACRSMQSLLHKNGRDLRASVNGVPPVWTRATCCASLLCPSLTALAALPYEPLGLSARAMAIVIDPHTLYTRSWRFRHAGPVSPH